MREIEIKEKKNTRDILWYFGHYWVAGMVLAVIGAIVGQLAALPASIEHLIVGEGDGTIIVRSWGWVIPIVLEILFIPFAFGWLMHRAVIKLPILQDLLSGWLAYAEPTKEEDESEDAEPADEAGSDRENEK